MTSLILQTKNKLFYGWILVAASLIINVVLGTRYSFGVFFKSLESEFCLNRTVTSGVFSTYMAFCCVFGVLGGWVLDKYGPRKVIFLMGLFTGLSLLLTSQTKSSWQLFITYSLLLAMGTGSTYTVLMATISRWFAKKRGLALGIAGSGVGLGTVIMAPFATALILNFNWSVAYIVMGLIAGLAIASLSMLFLKTPSDIGALPDGVKVDSAEIEVRDTRNDAQSAALSLREIFRTGNFWFLWTCWFLWSLCLNLVLTHVVPHATDVGISGVEAAAALSLIGGTNIAGRLILGGLSDRMGKKEASIICALLQAAAMVWLTWSQGLWMFYIFAAVYGFGYGGFGPPMIALFGDIFGLRNIGVVMGAGSVGFSLGAAIGPLIGGFVFDVNRNYALACWSGAVAMLIVALFISLIRPEAKSV